MSPICARDGLVDELVGTASQLTGTAVSADSPLMSVGLDSVSATEFSTSLSARLETNLPSTLLFDHPSISSIAGSLNTDEVLNTFQPQVSTKEASQTREVVRRKIAVQPPAITRDVHVAANAIRETFLEI